MATQATIPTGVAPLAVKPEQVTFAVIGETKQVKGKDASGAEVMNTVTAYRHTSSEKEIADFKANNPSAIAFEQTITNYKIGSIDGITELIPDAEEQVNIFNKGLGSKFNQKVKTLLTEVDENGNLTFQPVDGSYDAKDLLQEAAKRQSLSETDKALKILANLSPEVKAAILAQMANSTVSA